MERRLAAILAADAVGYSRQMGQDEAAAHACLTARLDQVLKPQIANHNGRIVNVAGDGVLAEFASVVDALACADDIQAQLSALNDEADNENRLEFRIGINLGDIAVANGTIHGDSVNIAVRLEGLAEPGGIVVSRAVRDHVGNKLAIDFKPMGRQTLKNITRPVSCFEAVRRSSNGEQSPQTLAQMARHILRLPLGAQRPGHALLAIVAIVFLAGAWFWQSGVRDSSVDEPVVVPAKPSIAVLPFDNLNDDPNQEIFSDAMAHDIITDLSEFGGLFVIAANSTFRYKDNPVRPQRIADELGVRYVLEGSVQRLGDQVRVNAQLIEAATARHLWAERFERPADDLFAVQNEISRRIVDVVAPVSVGQGRLLKAELERLEQTPTTSLEAYDHYLQGVQYLEIFARDENLLARQSFQRAEDLDPFYAKAIAKNARTYINEYWNGWTDQPQAALAMADEVAERAVAVDPGEADAHVALGTVRLFERRHDLAVASFQKAAELNPNGADILMYLGWALNYAGEPERGLASMQKAIVRNPYHPGWYLWDVAWGHFMLKEYEQATAEMEKRIPPSNFTHMMLAVLYKKLGRDEEAAKSMDAFIAVEPHYTVELAAEVEPFKHDIDRQHFLDALREAGLPETASPALN